MDKTSALLIACLLAALFDPTFAFAQFTSTHGTVTDLSVKPDTADIRGGAAQVDISFRLETTSDFRSGLIYLASPTGRTVFTGLNVGDNDPRDAWYSPSVTLAKYREAGHWRVERIYIQTVDGNSTIRIPEEEDLGIYVLSDIIDRSPPTYSELVVQPDTIDIGNGHQYVHFSIRVEDDLSGLDFGSVRIRPEGATGLDLSYPSWGFRGSNVLEGDSRSGYYEGTVRIDAGEKTGRWIVNNVALRDNLDNFRQTNVEDYSFYVQSTPEGPPSPDVPVLISPDDGATHQAKELALIFRRIDENAGYRVQVSTDTTFDSVVAHYIIASTTDEIAASFTSGTPGRTYYWRVRAQMGISVRPWSPFRSFKINDLPSIPETVSPTDADTVAGHAMFVWSSVGNVDSYELRLRNLMLDNSQTFETSDTIYHVDGLRGGTEYSWTVRSKNNAGYSAWTEAVPFSTELTAPGAVALSVPGNEAMNQRIPILLEWQGVNDVAVYEAEVSSTMDFAGVVFKADTLTRSRVQVDLLDNEATYFWRVRAGNDGGWGEWSEIRSFSTVVAAPNAVTLDSPGHETTEQPLPLTLTWAVSDDADAYEAQLARDDAFLDVVHSVDDLTETSFDVGPLDHATTYFWRVRAINAGGWGTWSEVRSFTTTSTSTSTEDEYVPTSFALHQNYPNPFNPQTTIVFDLPNAGHVQLKIYSITGSEVATLVDSVLPATRHEITWDARGWPSGTYIYVVRAGDQSLSRRMVLVK